MAIHWWKVPTRQQFNNNTNNNKTNEKPNKESIIMLLYPYLVVAVTAYDEVELALYTVDG